MLGPRRLLTPIAGWVLFALLAATAAGGLGWVSVAGLGIEAAEREATARAESANRERLALWQLDGRLFPPLGVENDRAFAHYYPLSLQPAIGFAVNGDPTAGPVPVPSPLLTADLPGWMLLHFQLDPDAGWSSPQVPPPEVAAQLPGEEDGFPPPTNATDERRALLDCLRRLFPHKDAHAQLVELATADPADSVLSVPYPLANNEPGDAQKENPPAAAQQAAGNVAPLQTQGGYSGAPGATQFGRAPGNYPARGGNENPMDNSLAVRDKVLRQSVGKPGGNTGVPNDPPAPPPSRGMKAAAQPAPAAGLPAAPAGPGGPPGAPPPAPAGGVPTEAKKAEEPAKQKLDEAQRLAAPRAELSAKTPDRAAGADTYSVKDATGKANRRQFGNLRAPTVQVGPVRPHWLTAADNSRHLVLVRAARTDGKVLFQGVLLDWPKLRDELTDGVRDTLPAARLSPVADPADSSERRMAALPVVLDAGPPPAPPPAGWTPLRLGLALTWAAAAVALAAVGAGGRALVSLSERRIRFVSAVTHELRTPLTSLRLYLDLLTSGLVTDEGKRAEYLSTLSTESDRLNRLIENVLDFARLEKRTVRAHVQPTRVADLLDEARRTWADRLAADGKELVVLNTLPPDLAVSTDPRMVGQVVGNLIDNARKYSKAAADPRVWLWAKPGDGRRVVLEVEDRGPGVPAADRCRIFRPFRRGPDADTTAGGAGLGLALARQWAELLGGRLSCVPAAGGVGACFRLELPCR